MIVTEEVVRWRWAIEAALLQLMLSLLLLAVVTAWAASNAGERKHDTAVVADLGCESAAARSVGWA